MMFVVNNLESVQTNSSVHGMNTRKTTHFHGPVANLLCVQKGVSCFCIKFFIILPTGGWNSKMINYTSKLLAESISNISLHTPFFQLRISYTQSRRLPQLIFVTLNIFNGNNLHFKYDNEVIMLLILLLIYSILYLLYIAFILYIWFSFICF